MCSLVLMFSRVTVRDGERTQITLLRCLADRVALGRLQMATEGQQRGGQRSHAALGRGACACAGPSPTRMFHTLELNGLCRKGPLCSIAKILLFCCPLCVYRLLKKFTMWRKKGAEAEPEPGVGPCTPAAQPPRPGRARSFTLTP